VSAEIEQEVEQEVQLLLPILTHPAGFNIDLFGGLLGVNGTEDPEVWEVSWDLPRPGDRPDKGHRAFKTAQEALRFFCLERRRRELGLEFEIQK